MTPFDGTPVQRLAFSRMYLHGFEANHFSTKFPSIHLTISDLNQTISCEGSYPLVAFPAPDYLQHTGLTRYGLAPGFTFCICGPADINHMYQRIGMSQVVQKFIPQAFPFMCPRH